MIIHLVCAARPNFMKVAPLYHALMKEPWASPAGAATQHDRFDDATFRIRITFVIDDKGNDFFKELNLG